MKGRSTGFLTETDRGSPTKKAGKSPKKPTCVYEGENVPMKAKSTGFHQNG